MEDAYLCLFIIPPQYSYILSDPHSPFLSFTVKVTCILPQTVYSSVSYVLLLGLQSTVWSLSNLGVYLYSRGRYYSWRKHTAWHHTEDAGYSEIPPKESLLLDYFTPTCKLYCPQWGPHHSHYMETYNPVSQGDIRTATWLFHPQKDQPIAHLVSHTPAHLNSSLVFHSPFKYQLCCINFFGEVKKNLLAWDMTSMTDLRD